MKKKTNIIVSRTTLCTQKVKFCMKNIFFQNFFVCTKFDLQLKKNLKKLSPSKNASHTIFIDGNCMESIFFKKIFEFSFFLSPVCSTVFKKPQKGFKLFSIVFRKCMKIGVLCVKRPKIRKIVRNFISN